MGAGAVVVGDMLTTRSTPPMLDEPQQDQIVTALTSTADAMSVEAARLRTEVSLIPGRIGFAHALSGRRLDAAVNEAGRPILAKINRLETLAADFRMRATKAREGTLDMDLDAVVGLIRSVVASNPDSAELLLVEGGQS